MYTGIRDIKLTDEDLAKYYEGNLEFDLLKNEYLILRNSNGDIVEKLKFNGKKLIQLTKKTFKNGFSKDTIKPLNIEQECWFDSLDNKDTTVKIVYGGYGSGKTYNAFYWALGQIYDGSYEKLVYIRNNVPAKDVPTIGLIKGGVDAKLMPSAMPMVDILGSMSTFEEYIYRGTIELAPLEYVRGRTFRNSIILVSECQNITKDIIVTLLSRVGDGSVIIFDGDERQSDSKVFIESMGIHTLVETLKGNELVSIVRLNKCVRSKTAALCELFE